MLRLFHHYVSMRKVTLFAAEGMAIGIAGALGAVLLAHASAASPVSPLPLIVLVGIALAIAVAFQFTLYLSDLYDFKVARDDRARGARLLKAAGAAALAVAGMVAVLRVPTPAGTLLGAAAGAVAGAIAIRSTLAPLVARPSRLLVVGIGRRAQALVTAVEQDGEGSFEIVGQLDLPASADQEALDKAAARLDADYVVLAADDTRGFDFAESLVRCRFDGRLVYDGAGFCERVLRRLPLAHLRGIDLAFSDEMTVSSGRRMAKRLFDLAMASALLVLALPIMAVVAIVIRLTSKGPIFYRQERLGRAGRVFSLWKFRSMRTDAEKDGAVWARANDDRVTGVGRFIRKTRIDEIPQVLNVLVGHMSFVGPRPERPVFVSQLKEEVPFYALREGVKPGITGWAQIRYPYGASVEDARRKLEYDLYYVKNGSVFLDVGIIFHTIRHVLTGRGAR